MSVSKVVVAFGLPVAVFSAINASIFTVVVNDPTGAHISGAMVRLSSLERVVRDKTGVDGSVRFRDVAPGKYDLEVSLLGFITQTFRDVNLPRRDGTPLEITLLVAPTSYLCGTPNLIEYDTSTPNRAAVLGRILNADSEAPLSGVKVQILKAGETRVLVLTHTNKRGGFVFDELPPGRYDVRATKDFYYDSGLKGLLTPREATAVIVIFMDTPDHIHLCQ